MILRRSGYAHLIALDGAAMLAIHAVTQMRVTVAEQVGRLIQAFDHPSDLDRSAPLLAASLGSTPETIRACALLLRDRGILTDLSPDQERQATTDLLTADARDPIAALDRHRRSRLEGAHPYWAVEAPHNLAEAAGFRHRRDVLLLGDCDVQMEADFLRREAGRRGVDLRAVASFVADTELARERPHDAIIVGALQARHAIVLGDPAHHDGDPARVYVDSVRTLLTKLRAITAAPILIDGLAEPTVQPLGFADSGIHSHRNRFRRTNLGLVELTQDFADVHLVDVAAAFAAAGNATLLDDGLVSFTHFGSAGWMLQRPSSELAAVHNQFPDLAPLADHTGGDPYRRETIMARAHMDTLAIVLGLDRKKCVIIDLDGVLWPGVLAETGRPFAWSPEVSGPNAFIGLYYGIHEALLSLRRRGILLACVSKNDQATVQGLWRYSQHDPRHRLLRLDHFVCSRINWRDKAENIASIAEELGFPLDSFLFIDDSARERERISQTLPQIGVLGDDLFALRRILLTDPRLQPARLTQEAERRSELVRAQLDRSRLRAAIPDQAAFIASLNVVADVRRSTPDTADRVRELFARTTQFNATGETFTHDALQRLTVFVLRMRDRLADHGLVGAAVVEADRIRNIVLSCRVIGLGGEHALLSAVIDAARGRHQQLSGRIVPTDRNSPVRNLFADHGFTAQRDGVWTLSLVPPDMSGSVDTIYRIAGRLVPDAADAVA